MDFISPYSSTLVFEGNSVGEEDSIYVPPLKKKELIENFEKATIILSKLWLFWKSEYLLSLREKQRVMYQRSRHISDSTPKPGQVVLIEYGDDQRDACKLARIDSLISDFMKELGLSS